MKVVYFSHSDGIYGAPKSLIDLIEQLKKECRDFYPIVVTSKKNALNSYCQKHGIENYSVYYTDCLYGYEKNRTLKQIIHDMRVYIKMNFRYHTLNQLAINKICKLIDFTDVDLIHTNVSTIDIGFFISQKYGIPHIWHIREYGKSGSYSFLPYSRMYYQRIISANYVIYISKYVKNNWECCFLNKEKAMVVYDVVKKVNFNSNRVDSNKIRILFSGSSTPAKGIMDLINAINLVVTQKNNLIISVDIYGDYNDEFGKEVKKLVSQYALEKVITFKGFDSGLTDKMTEYDIGVIGSRSEAFGRITIEYMSAGLYIVATNSGANPELLETLKFKKMYQFGNSMELAERLIDIIESVSDWNDIRVNAYEGALRINDSSRLARVMMEMYYDSIRGVRKNEN